MDSKLEKLKQLESSANAKISSVEQSGIVWIKCNSKDLPGLSEK